MIGELEIKITMIDGVELNGKGLLDELTMVQESIDVTEFGSLSRQLVPGYVTYKVNATLNSLTSKGKNVMEDSFLRKTVKRLTRKLDR